MGWYFQLCSCNSALDSYKGQCIQFNSICCSQLTWLARAWIHCFYKQIKNASPHISIRKLTWHGLGVKYGYSYRYECKYKDGSSKLMTTRHSRKLEHKYMCSCTCVPWWQVLCVFNASVQLKLQSWLQSTFVGDPYIKTK